ncbi:phage-shock protein [Ureibacillus massiliensis 4400831 = CIP 108448 = CCUG 49529]|uniref:Phage-shock protein n=1 Tax=Ureibacillus massiliensis 4400831 = CIP 108448 = CCUG 49529 TaxID=1211035 RepID=A0A0A3JQP8_9BACL|nr:PspA/IM30 family protein [Ureibacillus massiliensis]KGR89322.1 phage-shock protein [Ureibacillus massiliensis 4400831 = CIP 108448 = CCUG 49529]
MTNLFDRFKYQIKADLHEFFDKKESKNPIAMLNQYIREAEKQTEQTGKLLQRQLQLKNQLQREYDEANTMLEKRTSQLALAKESGELDLIAFAEKEVETYTLRTSNLLTSIETTKVQVYELESKYETMKHKIKDMKVRQLELMGKENVVRAHHKMDHVIESSNETNFEDISAYIDHLSAKIDKKYEVTMLESRLAQLGKKNKNSHSMENTVESTSEQAM